MKTEHHLDNIPEFDDVGPWVDVVGGLAVRLVTRCDEPRCVELAVTVNRKSRVFALRAFELAKLQPVLGAYWESE